MTSAECPLGNRFRAIHRVQFLRLGTQSSFQNGFDRAAGRFMFLLEVFCGSGNYGLRRHDAFASLRARSNFSPITRVGQERLKGSNKIV